MAGRVVSDARRNYYGDRSATQVRPALAVVPSAIEPPAMPDRRAEPVVGAQALADRLGIPVKDLYRLMAPDKRTRAAKNPPKPPIRRSPLGLVADGPTLDAWWLAYCSGRAD